MNAATPPIKLACRNVWKVYGRRPAYYFDSRGYIIEPDALAERLRAEAHLPAVVDATFEVATGEIFVIMGLSGSGKSTLVRCLSRLVEPSAGEILLDGQDLLKASGKELIELRRHAMGMVFQNFGLLPHLTILGNVAFPLKIQGKPVKEREARAREMIALVGLEGREASFPHQLSGGQQQRVGIARSLAVGPELWFLDEPFSALDPLIRRQMQDEFLRLQRMLKKTIVFITHDMAEAFRLADRLAIMRAGKIVQIGRPADIVLNPADDYVAQFTEDMPLLRVITAGDLATPLEAAAAPDETIAADTSLEDLIPRLASGVRAFSVMGEGDAPPTLLTAGSVLAVLEREQKKAHALVTAPAASFRSSPRVAIEPALLPWCVFLVLTALCLVVKADFPWLAAFPKEWTLPLAPAINAATDAVVTVVQPAFRALSAALEAPMRGARLVLVWLPWPAVMLAVVALALKSSGIRLAVFAVLALGYILLAGYWPQSMSTLSLVLLAVPISTMLGFALGVLGHASSRLRPALLGALDLMQTVPAFAYLIPLLLLFGFGPVVGLIASAIYATPPMVRNTMLGLDRVPSDIGEAGLMSGCTRRQQFWHVEVPTALPQILVGFNQTTMAALSMVIVAAIIGGFEDIGWEVLSSMRKAEFGQSILSGLVIALLAILIDRLTIGFAKERPTGPTAAMRWMTGRRLVMALLLTVVLAIAIRLIWPDETWLPASGLRMQVGGINQWLLGLVRDYAWFFDGLRNGVLYCLLLPLRIGIAGAAVPAIWGFSLSPTANAAYVVAILLACTLLLHRLGWRPALAVLVAGMLLYTGFLGFPWPVFILGIALLAFQVAGLRLALFAAAGFLLILFNGLWGALIQSLYLCTLAVLLCLVIGGALGVWAAYSERASRALRSVCDALQTMPQFVFLIPALMFFKVGEFTALIAIMLYAIVPPIRYVEHGLRHVRADVVEAVEQMGATPAQTLLQAKLPLALPVVMLGLNQTIMAALSMLAIAALVGTRDLGQAVYVALGKADAGMGLIAGLSIAFLAILADRLIQAAVAGRANG